MATRTERGRCSSADLSSGGGESTVNNWSLEIQAVPEPVNMALVVFGIAMSIVVLKRSRRGNNFCVRKNK
ncbi:MAG: hypothetical protein WDM76_06770 [Limisphaerales bacterium]